MREKKISLYNCLNYSLKSTYSEIFFFSFFRLEYFNKITLKYLILFPFLISFMPIIEVSLYTWFLAFITLL